MEAFFEGTGLAACPKSRFTQEASRGLFGWMRASMEKKYRWIATSPGGFLRQLVSNYLPHGYRFYVSANIKPSRDPAEFDRVMQRKFRYQMSPSQRNRRKNVRGPDGRALGLANIHFLRYERYWILLSTKGEHRFFDEHVKRDRWGNIARKYFRDVHRDPIFFDGYSIRVVEGGYLPRYRWKDVNRPERDTRRRVRVRIARETYQTLKADFIARARSGRWSARALETAVFSLPFLPYAAVREQLWHLVRWMNEARKERGFRDRLDPRRCIRRKIPAVSPFEQPMASERKAA